jgi:hypothetical protein
MLPYNTDILFSIFSHYNSLIWPALLIIHGILLAFLYQLLRGRSGRWLDAGINTLLILVWLWVAIGFYHVQFSDFNFMAPIYGWVFITQALLLTIITISHWRLEYRFDGNFFNWCGIALIATGLALVPLLDWICGANWHALRWFASGPEATLLVSVGLLLLSTHRVPWLLLLIPLIVSIKIAVLAYFLSYIPDYFFAAACTAGTVVLLLKRARTGH